MSPNALLGLAAVGILLLSGCASVRQTDPDETAREQLLISTAADSATAQIAPNLPPGDTIYVDTSLFGDTTRTANDNYAIVSIKTALLRQGYNLVDDRRRARTIAMIGRGALSIDKRDNLIGIPSTEIPIPLAGPLDTPEVALWKRSKQTGVAKLQITFYNADSGTLEGAPPAYVGTAFVSRSSVLFVGQTRSNLPTDSRRARTLVAPVGETAN
ncbi:DUF6655 family protein [Salinisphaera sp. Q1T1-3]|uniref:DUF6655 family protein n=1 Tax=Salinisphaera sp. Q1T1-3 TaxID=2321229 RepID=UPI000E731B62|nr:DUF6655 family protein [Salinisphaera sp. Q1T1-3]RJS93031.1 hypothetical protein D3260_09015 [Salinisphaera sp. Q1T1-3]